jgi:hypothetical protein
LFGCVPIPLSPSRATSLLRAVFIECPDGIRNYPDDFDNLISDSREDSALRLQQTESHLLPFDAL